MAAIGLHSLADFNMYIPANAMILAWICGISAGLPSRYVPVKTSVGLKWFAIAVSCLLVIYSPAWIVFESAFRSDLPAERLFCRFGICDTEAVLAAKTLEYGGAVAAVPASVLVEAVRRDAADPERWCDLGEAMLKARQPAPAPILLLEGHSAGPEHPVHAYQGGQFSL